MLEKAPSSSSSQTAHSDFTMIESRRLFLAALITAALGLGTAPLSALAGDDDDDDDDRRFGSRHHRRDDETMTTTDGVAPAQEGIDVTMMTINSNFLSQL